MCSIQWLLSRFRSLVTSAQRSLDLKVARGPLRWCSATTMRYWVSGNRFSRRHRSNIYSKTIRARPLTWSRAKTTWTSISPHSFSRYCIGPKQSWWIWWIQSAQKNNLKKIKSLNWIKPFKGSREVWRNILWWKWACRRKKIILWIDPLDHKTLNTK